MTCAKTTVTCILVGADGDRLVTASNACDNPQVTCPREPGEGYAKCISICQQRGHAETQALENAKQRGIQLSGATAYIRGHTYACQHCQEALYGAGVRFIDVRK